jgi:hypothetical protein
MYHKVVIEYVYAMINKALSSTYEQKGVFTRSN